MSHGSKKDRTPRGFNARRLGFYLTPVLVIATLATLWFLIIKPSLLEFVTAQLPRVNQVQNVVHVEVGGLDLSLLRLQITAFDVKATFRGPEQLEPLHIDTLRAQADIFDLIIGQIQLARVTADGVQWRYAVKPSDSTEPPRIPVPDIFRILESVPVHRLVVSRAELGLELPEEALKGFTGPPRAAGDRKTSVHVRLPLLTVTNRKNELRLETEKVGLQFDGGGNEPVQGEGDLSATLTPDRLNVHGLELRLLDSTVKLTAALREVETLLQAPTGQVQLQSRVNLQDVRSVALLLFPQKKRIPAGSGFIEASGSVTLAKGLKNLGGSLEVQTTPIVVDHLKFGKAAFTARFRKGRIEIDKALLEHPAGRITLNDLRLSPEPPYTFSAEVAIENFDLQKMFGSLELHDIPAGFVASGRANCEGHLRPGPEADCRVLTDLRDIWVKPGHNDKLNILKIRSARLEGDTHLNMDGLTYSSRIQVGGSRGESRGAVLFAKGFDIQFETERLDFNDVESLADLNVRGEMKIKGISRGDASHGMIDAGLQMKNAELDGFRLGELGADLEYADSELSFTGLTARVGKSDIAGDLHFFFARSDLQGEFRSSNISGQDILYILGRRFDIPFTLTGSGQASASVRGPFNFWKLRYDVQAELRNGALADERFDRLLANLQADGNRINFREVRLQKLKSSLALEGYIDTTVPDPRFNLTLRANPLLLEETDHVIRHAPSIAGVGYAEGQITGTISDPQVGANFTLRQVSYDKVDYPNSQGEFHIDKKNFRFNGQFFGRQIQSDIVWPWNEKDPFTLKVLVRDLNPLFLLPLVSIPQPGSDFSSRLNADIDLSARTRRFSAADGHIKITDFFLQRGNQSLRLEKPASLVFRSGLSYMEPLSLRGNDAFLTVKMSQSSSSNLRLDVAADLQLRMFHFLVPFAQSLSGNLSLNSQIVFRDDSFELFGEGELVDGLISMKGFPQALENINTPIEFSKSRIFLSDITAQLGQSDVTGIGQIEILGAKNIAVNLRAVADNVELTFPDQIFTAGRANVQFSGNWLPYTLKVDYVVSHGLVEKDFEQDSSQATALQASSFLPPQQAEQLTPSLALDVNIDATRGLIIRNSLLEGEAAGTLKITGSPEAPILAGKIDIRPGSKIFFKDKPFDVQTATIRFRQTREINPDIYISANSRISDYDINLLVQGTAKNLAITPTSQPPLSESDLFSLIALGVTSQSDQYLSSDTQQKQTGLEVLAAISNQSQLNKRIQEKLGLTVQLAPSVDSTKNIAVPKVVVSKKISDKLNASYSKPFTGNDQNQEIKLQYLYNKNVSFLLNYQNKDTLQQEQINNTNNNNKGILGLDLEYREDFK